jgi:hypothetical protein
MLYPLYCTLQLCTLAHRKLHTLVALSPTFVSDTFIQLLRCTFHWLQLNKRVLLLILLRDQQTFFHIHSFCWKMAVATTALNFCTRYSYFLILFCSVSTLGLHPAHPTFLYQVIFVPYSGSGIIPRSSLSGAGQLGLVGVLGIWRGWDNWVKGGANRVSLQAT